MQMNFYPHLPPGYFETHELEGLNWKSEKPVRDAINERMAAQAVKQFERDSRQEMNRQRRAKICATIPEEIQGGGNQAGDSPAPMGEHPCIFVETKHGNSKREHGGVHARSRMRPQGQPGRTRPAEKRTQDPPWTKRPGWVCLPRQQSER